MPDKDYDGFYIIWLDDSGEEIGDEWIFKMTFDAALRSAGLRIYQSPHKCPPDTAGFYIEQVQRWRERHGKENKLTELS